MKLNFDRISGLLPTLGPVERHSLSPKGKTPIFTLAEINESFIPPEFSMVSKETPPDDMPQFVLLSAPAATGKSEIARQLSAKTGNPLWDLSKFNLGHNIFTGSLVQHFGFDTIAEFMGRLGDGRVSLILDAADEALVRSGINNYAAAMEDLIGLVKSQSVDVPTAVILGRPDSMQTTSELLKSHGAHYEHYHVNFFDEPMSRAFVQAKATLGQHSVLPEMSDFMTRFFEETKLSFGVTRWEEIDDFLGYAPVLDALARFYIEIDTNPLAYLNETLKDGGNHRTWGLLWDIVERILARETNKFSRSFADSDEEKYAYGEKCYSISNQIRMLVSPNPAEADLDFPETSIPQWEEDVRVQMQQQFSDHPFLSLDPNRDAQSSLQRICNVAFRDYIMVRAVLSNHDETMYEVLIETSTQEFTHSPLFAKFLFVAPTDSKRISEDVLPLLMDSHFSSQFSRTSPLSISQESHFGASDDLAFTHSDSIFVAYMDLADGGLASTTSELQFEGLASGSFQLRSGASNCFIFLLDYTISFGIGRMDFVLGPRTTIFCKSIEADASEIRIIADTPFSNFLRTQRISGSTRAVRAPLANSFAIFGTRSAYPWHDYIIEPRQAGSTLSGWVDPEAAVGLRGFVLWANRYASSAGQPSRYRAQQIDHLLARRRVSERVVSFLIDKGYMSKQGSLYTITFPCNVRSILQVDSSDDTYQQLIRELSAYSL
ncbi:hypothetical protein [Kocuria sp. CNJ-770]|uniref:hypothetical protein n=1 Tax=Kocuria sp. CNJ-770 TaxID=1904964 RepID=UPI0011153706|nr:hypothetical protein [Kocuria sp. CNJ-770]